VGSTRPGVGGLGPLGIDRPPGAAASDWRWWPVPRAGCGTRDHRAAVIDWTTLADFYGRLGARAWRVYQRAEGDL
jgi:hypothetical protein